MTGRAVEIVARGEWPETRVVAQWSDVSSWQPPDTTRQRQIDFAWSTAQKSAGDASLFDGALCRLEAHAAADDALILRLAPTSYRHFVGTNMFIADQPGDVDPDTLANPLGLSAALISADDCIVFGRRNDRVAYYPGRIHPFAGSLEPPKDHAPTINVFDGILLELNEEVNLTPDHLTSLTCIGLAKDGRLRQPELVFEVRTTHARNAIAAAVDVVEHAGIWSVPLTSKDLATALDEPLLTPIAVASMLLLGGRRFGTAWFDRNAGRFATPGQPGHLPAGRATR